jgi:hypothetical protein
MTIDVGIINKVYSGRPGCGCGCRGRYWTDKRNIKRIVNTMNARSSEIDDTPVGDGGHIYAVENETRWYWAYTEKEA